MENKEKSIVITDLNGKAYTVTFAAVNEKEDVTFYSKSKRDKKFFGRLAKTMKEIPNLMKKAYMNWYEKKLEKENITLSNADSIDIDVSLEKLEKKLSKTVQSHIKKINANLTDINNQITSLYEEKALAEGQERNLMELEASKNPQYKYFYDQVDNLQDKVQIYELVINGLEELNIKRQGYIEAAKTDPRVAKDLQKILSELALQEQDYLNMEGFHYESLETLKVDYEKAKEELKTVETQLSNMYDKLIKPEVERYEKLHSKNNVRISREYREELSQNIKDLEAVASQLEQEILEAEKTTSDNLGKVKNDEIVLVYNAIQTRKGLKEMADKNLDALMTEILNEEVIKPEQIEENFEQEQEEYLTEQVGEIMSQMNESVISDTQENFIESTLESLDNGELDIVSAEQELTPVEHYSMANGTLEVVGSPVSSIVESVPSVSEEVYAEPIEEVVQEPVQEIVQEPIQETPIVEQVINNQNENINNAEKLTLVDYNETETAKEMFEKTKAVMSDYSSQVINMQIENEKKIVEHYSQQFDTINKQYEGVVNENKALVEKLNSQEEINKRLEATVKKQEESIKTDYVPVATVDVIKNDYNNALTQKENTLIEETNKRKQVEANLAMAEQKNSELSMTVTQKDQVIASLNDKIENEYVPKKKYEDMVKELETIKMQISALTSFIQVPSNVNEQTISPNTDEVSTGGKHM